LPITLCTLKTISGISGKDQVVSYCQQLTA